jgi:ABC-type nickel/cobalt efflux system permease component RcnA
MNKFNQRGQARLTAVLLLIGLIVTGVWVWKRLSPDIQDQVVEQAIPLVALCVVVGLALWVVFRKIRRRREARRQRERLMARFERESSIDKKRDLAFALIEINNYQLEGLERVAPTMTDLFITTLKTALGDKQHRIRGMAASHLGILQNKATIPFLLKALEDDHAYVRSCAALALGRMRAREARAKLQQVMEEDWDQTVRSRAREALERIA